eukprot:gene33854-43740_t
MSQRSFAKFSKNNARGRGGKGPKDNEPKNYERKLSGAIDSLPVLKPPRSGRDFIRVGDPRDFSSWEESLQLYVRREYGDIADMFTTRHYPVFEEVEPNMDEINAGGTRRFMERTRIAARIKDVEYKRAKLETDKKRVFAVLMGQLSEESLAKVKAIAGWDDAQRAEDPMELYTRIIATHIAPLTDDIHAQRYDIDNNYRFCHQGKEESTADYLKRFRNCLAAMDVIDIARPEDIQQALHFFNGLDKVEDFRLQKSDVILKVASLDYNLYLVKQSTRWTLLVRKKLFLQLNERFVPSKNVFEGVYDSMQSTFRKSIRKTIRS